ncbi:MAG: exo-alpha-sialidase [Rhodoferax sp.]|nr:exo-alpha-sialidase [Rhodoferax sp.]
MIVHPLLLRCALALLLIALALGWNLSQRPAPPLVAQAAVSPGQASAPGRWVQRARGSIPMPDGVLAAHASDLLAMPAAHAAALTVFWFAGDRESAPNVQIAASQFDRSTQAWTAPQFVVNRHVVGAALGAGVRRIGNPVAWIDATGRMHLFVVGTGWGGWAASRIVHLRQVSAFNDPALRFEPLGVLPMSWLWNLSYLVRTAPLPLADGGMVLPAYFELGSKTPVALRFGAQGDYLGMVRISQRTFTLQPALLALGPSHWTALMRDHGDHGKIRVAETLDGGATWREGADLPLDNPDAGIATLSVGAQHLLAFNPSSSDRQTLRLASASDGVSWSTVEDLERAGPGYEYSYPAMAWADQSLWVSYTDRRKRIAWRRFDWVANPSSTTLPALPPTSPKAAP